MNERHGPQQRVAWSYLLAVEMNMKKLSEKKKRGCPTCSGVDSRSCMRCHGKTRMCDWYNTETGWAHYTQLNHDERQKVNAAHAG